MKILLKITVIYTLLLGAIYQGYFFLSPNITVDNQSGYIITNAQVALRNSRLGFGAIPHNTSNTIYYDIKQQDGSYHYTFTLSNTNKFTGECGYITHSEYHKHVILTVNPNGVTCQEHRS